MKKTLLSLVGISSLLLSASSFSAEEGTTYVGLKAGWGHVETNGHRRADLTEKDKDNFAGGLYAGYNLTSFLGLEAGYDYFGQYSNTLSNGKVGEFDVHGGELAALIGLPFNKTDDVFFKVGALVATVADDIHDSSATKTVPLVGIGTRFAMSDLMGLRLEYQYAHKFAEMKDFGYAPDLHNINLGLELRFGGSEEVKQEPIKEPVKEPKKEPKLIQKNISLDSTALFNFGKSTLTPSAQNKLDSIAKEVNGYNLKNLTVTVEGHTDSIGSAKSNQKLSEERALSVVNELKNKGLNANSIEGVGYGETKSITRNKCDSLKGQKKIDCLSPDRRVEIKVNGIQEYTE